MVEDETGTPIAGDLLLTSGRGRGPPGSILLPGGSAFHPAGEAGHMSKVAPAIAASCSPSSLGDARATAHKERRTPPSHQAVSAGLAAVFFGLSRSRVQISTRDNALNRFVFYGRASLAQPATPSFQRASCEARVVFAGPHALVYERTAGHASPENRELLAGAHDMVCRAN